MWEDELKKKWYLHHYDKEQEYYVTIEEDVIEFIHSLLKQQRDKYYYHIENSVGTKEADYIDKMIKGEVK